MPKSSQPLSMNSGPRPAKPIDGRGDGAAWLILKVASAVAALEPGQVLEVWGSDPKLKSDLPLVLARHGCRLLEARQVQRGYRFLLVKPGRPRTGGEPFQTIGG